MSDAELDNIIPKREFPTCGNKQMLGHLCSECSKYVLENLSGE